MANTSTPIPRVELEARIKEVDKFLNSPSLRVRSIYETYPNLVKIDSPEKAWNLICFCNEVLTMFAASTHHFLQSTVRPLNQAIYFAHYTQADNLGLLDSSEHLKQRWDILNQEEPSPALQDFLSSLKELREKMEAELNSSQKTR